MSSLCLKDAGLGFLFNLKKRARNENNVWEGLLPQSPKAALVLVHPLGPGLLAVPARGVHPLSPPEPGPGAQTQRLPLKGSFTGVGDSPWWSERSSDLGCSRVSLHPQFAGSAQLVPETVLGAVLQVA